MDKLRREDDEDGLDDDGALLLLSLAAEEFLLSDVLPPSPPAWAGCVLEFAEPISTDFPGARPGLRVEAVW